MKEKTIEAIGNAAFSRSLKPLKRESLWKYPVIGFDTEYTSKGADLISFQLWCHKGGVFVPMKKGQKLTPLRIYHECIKLLGMNPSDVMLITFFSLAELQHMPLVTKGFRIREYAGGSVDVSFATSCGAVHVYDLQRWFMSPRQSLAKAADAFGLKKLDFDVRHVTRACLRSKKFRKYALHDAYLCYEIMHRLRLHFIDATNIDPVQAKTPASASAQAFRRLHVRKDYFCDKNRARFMALKGCWGGHAEVFKRGKLKGTYREYDFSSAYPRAALALQEMPVQKSWKEVRAFHALERCRGGFAHVRFAFADSERYPSLPVSVKNAMLYPLRGESFCTFEEVRAALDFEAKIKIIEAWGYRKGTPILADYLKWTLEERAKAKGAGRVMFKLLGNAIIGKFAQQVSKVAIDEYYRLAEDLDVYLDELFELNTEELKALGANTYANVGPIFMPEWNGLITGYTRAALARMIRSGRAVYCHTDSVWCKKRPECNGMLPFEVKTSGKVTIIRTRFAALGDEISRRAMLSKKSHIAYHSIWTQSAAVGMLRSFNGKDFIQKYVTRRPLKFRESVKSHRTPGTWVKEWRTGSTKWDNKRKLLPSGDTRPWASVTEYEKYLTDIRRK